MPISKHFLKMWTTGFEFIVTELSLICSLLPWCTLSIFSPFRGDSKYTLHNAETIFNVDCTHWLEKNCNSKVSFKKSRYKKLRLKKTFQFKSSSRFFWKRLELITSEHIRYALFFKTIYTWCSNFTAQHSFIVSHNYLQIYWLWYSRRKNGKYPCLIKLCKLGHLTEQNVFLKCCQSPK